MMAVDQHNSELLIPSQDLFDTLSLQNRNKDYLLFGLSESGSELSSPIDSDQQSSSFTESSEEGEEDCFIGELTRQMAQYMLQDEDKHEKSSPAVGDFENIKINEEKQALIDEKIRAIQFYKLKQQQAMKQNARIKHYQSKGSVFGGFNNDQKVAVHSNITPWYTLQQQQQQQQQKQSNQQTGSDMRAVFLNGPGSRNGSCGTGVFLPRGAGTPSNSRKKQGCATVLIPARVVQALKLHFEKTGVPSRFSTAGFNGTQEASESGWHSTNASQKGRSRAAEPVTDHHEDLSLPQEWTY